MLDVFVEVNKPEGLFYPLLAMFCSVALLAWIPGYKEFGALASSFVANVEGVVP